MTKEMYSEPTKGLSVQAYPAISELILNTMVFVVAFSIGYMMAYGLIDILFLPQTGTSVLPEKPLIACLSFILLMSIVVIIKIIKQNMRAIKVIKRQWFK